MCYFHLLYTTVFLLCFTQIPPHPNILSGFHVFYNLNNGNESVLKSSLCKFLAFLFSPLYPFVLKKTPLWYCYLLYVYITDLYICYFSHLRGMLSEYSCVIWQWVIKKKKGRKKEEKKKPFSSTLPSLDGFNVTWRGSRMSQRAVLLSKIPVCVTAGRQHLASCGFIFF